MASKKEISETLHNHAEYYPASFLPCGCCVHPRYQIVQLAGGKQRYDRLYDHQVSFCRFHLEAK